MSNMGHLGHREYAIYLCKQDMGTKQRFLLEEYEEEHLSRVIYYLYLSFTNLTILSFNHTKNFRLSFQIKQLAITYKSVY